MTNNLPADDGQHIVPHDVMIMVGDVLVAGLCVGGSE
jgi:hypothetical protein